MPKAKVKTADITTKVGKPQSEYAESVNRAGNYWLRRNSGISDAETPDSLTQDNDAYMRQAADSTRKMQLKDSTEAMRVNAAGGGTTPSYKRGGIVERTGLAMVHEGERIIPKEDVRGTVVNTRVIPIDAGWLVDPKNPVPYTGDNAPWRH